jgi:hypothetical protein
MMALWAKMCCKKRRILVYGVSICPLWWRNKIKEWYNGVRGDCSGRPTVFCVKFPKVGRDWFYRLVSRIIVIIPCGGGVEYLHRSPASPRRRRKGNPVPGGITGGDLNMGTWPSRLGESRIWDSKIWSWVPRESDRRMTVLARASKNCKLQTRPLVIEDVT